MVSEVWDYAKKVPGDNEKAMCNICSKSIACKGSSTKGLRDHLLNVHRIKLAEKRSSQEDIEASSSKKSGTILQFVRRTGLGEIVAKLTAKDGFSFHGICNSSFIREAVRERGFILPRNPSGVAALMHSFFKEKRQELIDYFRVELKNDKKFSLTVDEWTSFSNKRYMNINVHEATKHHNLGLVYIMGSCDAAKSKVLVDSRLKEFGLNWKRDIVGGTNDGAAVMKKFGRESPHIDQLCMAHGLNLAVIDMFYRKKIVICRELEDKEQLDNQSEDEIETLPDQVLFEDISVGPIEEFELVGDILAAINQVRTIVKFFRASPLRTEMLQQQVKIMKKKELKLILDCPTRWNSMLSMLARFVELEPAVVRCLDELGQTALWNKVNLPLLKEVVSVLEPVRLTSERLSAENATMLTMEGAFNFLLGKLESLDTKMSNELLSCIKKRIHERRNKLLVSLLLYLQNPDNLSKENVPRNYLELSTKNDVFKYGDSIMQRLFPEGIELTENVDAGNEDLDLETVVEIESQQPQDNLSDELNQAIGSVMELKEKSATKKTLRTEFNLFEVTGERSVSLQLLYKALLTIKPSSTQSERVFSTAGYFVTKIRSKLSNDSINALCFLKSYFLNKIES